MKHLFLILSIIGYAITMIPMLMYSSETGNILFLTDPAATTALLTSSIGVTTFSLDLFVSVFIFLIWVTIDSKKRHSKRAWMWWLICFVFGLAGTLPLYLYVRDKPQQ